MTTCPQAIPAVSLTAQTMLTTLLGMDHRSAALSQPSLGAVKDLFALVLQPIMSKLEREDPRHPRLVEIRNRLLVYDAMIYMPPAHGEFLRRLR
jgi:hypothetical protein